MKLLIVESPAKCKTIKSYLGPGYEVMASYGHIRDLAHDKHFFGIDIKNGFQPSFETLKEKYKYITPLKEAAKSASTIYLASDDDREGEAIAWHLAQVLKLDVNTNPRIVFREITKEAVLHALNTPTTINMDKVHSQQARQILDKLVGFELSPLLWQHISQGSNLSAGRVQSVVTRLVVDRERDIADFASKSYFKVSGTFKLFQSKPKPFPFLAYLSEKIAIESEAIKLLEDCLKATFKIASVDVKEENRNSKPPFITSTLQQEAGTRLGLSPKTTMSCAQKLYEKGKITYMRTDSTNISEGFQKQVQKFVTETYGPPYLGLKQWNKKIKGGQEAHECIRPTKAEEILPEGDFNPLEKKLYRIIWQRALASQIVPQRVEVSRINININIGIEDNEDCKHSQSKCTSDSDCATTIHKETFNSQFEKELFPGWTVLYKTSLNEIDGSSGNDDEDLDAIMDKTEKGWTNTSTDTPTDSTLNNESLQAEIEEETNIESPKVKISPSDYDNIIKTIKVGTIVNYMEINAIQKHTEPPARFTEASLVKMLENKGIGRPSTYSSMVDKVQEKGYVIKGSVPSKNLPITILEIKNGKSDTIIKSASVHKTRAEKNKLLPTDMGKIVTAFLIEHFDKLMDYSFTSEMEEGLDSIGSGEAIWNTIVKDYYNSFHPKVALLESAKTSGVLGPTIHKAKDKYRRLLGKHPINGQDVYVMLAKTGTCLQVGADPKSSQYYSVGKDLSIDTITWTEALKILEYPKILGSIAGKSVEIKKGPYGFYIKHDGKNIGVPKNVEVSSIDLKMAEDIINNKNLAEGKLPDWCLAKFEGEAGQDPIMVLKGKGFADKNGETHSTPYIKKGTMNISLKGKTDDEAKILTLSEVQKIIEEYIVNKSNNKSDSGRGRGGFTRGRARGRGRGGIIIRGRGGKSSLNNPNNAINGINAINENIPKKTTIIKKKVI